MKPIEYWSEVISDAASACGLELTSEQLKCLAASAESAHENYGMAFYSPPAGDRLAEIQREHTAKVTRLEEEASAYRRNAETAIKEALRQPSNAMVHIGEYGEVTRTDGRTTVIQ